MNPKKALFLSLLFILSAHIFCQSIQKQWELGKESQVGAAYTEEVKNREEIALYNVSPSSNSVGGTSVYFYLANASEKTIKYFYLDVLPLDTFFEPLTCNISSKGLVQLKLTGPILPQITNFYESEIAWYNLDIENIAIKGIKVIYTDGSIFETTDVDKIYSSFIRKYDMLQSER